MTTNETAVSAQQIRPAHNPGVGGSNPPPYKNGLGNSVKAVLLSETRHEPPTLIDLAVFSAFHLRQ